MQRIKYLKITPAAIACHRSHWRLHFPLRSPTDSCTPPGTGSKCPSPSWTVPAAFCGTCRSRTLPPGRSARKLPWGWGRGWGRCGRSGRWAPGGCRWSAPRTPTRPTPPLSGDAVTFRRRSCPRSTGRSRWAARRGTCWGTAGRGWRGSRRFCRCRPPERRRKLRRWPRSRWSAGSPWSRGKFSSRTVRCRSVNLCKSLLLIISYLNLVVILFQFILSILRKYTTTKKGSCIWLKLFKMQDYHSMSKIF